MQTHTKFSWKMQGGGGGLMLLNCEGESWFQLKNLVDYDQLFHALTTPGYECIMATDSPSDSSFFTLRSPSTNHWKFGGEVLDEDNGRDDGPDVGENDLENINELIGLTIPIVERNIDGSECILDEMNLRSSIGYYSFAKELSKLYKGSQPISAIAHVLWPCLGYETHYITDGGKELDPNFSTSLKCIVVQIQHISDNNVFLVHFQVVDEVITEYKISRRFITYFKVFVVIVHML
ncbi:uncharacterized protein [Coffea arabica]|uniref:Uncharacterized protein isoform X2 n=1 Tax=Coffea arabica TaxID=13443 RepID=A0ABM4X7U4_COFAR